MKGKTKPGGRPMTMWKGIVDKSLGSVHLTRKTWWFSDEEGVMFWGW